MPRKPASAIARLPAVDREQGHVYAVIEAPRGGRSKHKFEPALGVFVHDKSLPVGLAYPLDFGFVPSTRAPDGDPLDILVLMDEPSFVGAVVPCRVVGAIEAEQSDEETSSPVRNDRLIAVACKTVLYGHIAELVDLPDGLVEAVEDFFVMTSIARDRTFAPLRRVNASAANRLILSTKS